jgi:DNA-binding MarR family transcriptional regulator
MESAARDSDGSEIGWMIPMAYDNPRTLKALEKKGLIELENKNRDISCFRLTKAGVGMINKIQSNPHRDQIHG